MDDFETFKDSRKKVDPTARKMSAHQWQQAYEAYLRARERVGGSVSSEGKSKKQRRSSKKSSTVRGMHRPSAVSELGRLRHKVREQSAYADLRGVVDILAWVAVAIVALKVVVTLFYYTSATLALISLLGSGVQIIGILGARLLLQVLIDIPDIALFRSVQESAAWRQPTLDPESPENPVI